MFTTECKGDVEVEKIVSKEIAPKEFDLRCATFDLHAELKQDAIHLSLSKPEWCKEIILEWENIPKPFHYLFKSAKKLFCCIAIKKVHVLEGGIIANPYLKIGNSLISREVEFAFARVHHKISFHSYEKEGVIEQMQDLEELKRQYEMHSAFEKEYLRRMSMLSEGECLKGLLIEGGVFEQELVLIDSVDEPEYVEIKQSEEEFLNSVLDVYDWTLDEYDKAITDSKWKGEIKIRDQPKSNRGFCTPKGITMTVGPLSTKKDKMRFAKQMLKMGFTPTEIIERIELQKDDKMRNLASRRRPLTSELPPKDSSLMSNEEEPIKRVLSQKEILQILVRLLKSKMYKNVDELYRQMKIEGVEISLEEIKQKILQIREYKKKKLQGEITIKKKDE